MDLEQLKMMAEIFRPASAKPKDDSFLSFTGGVRENWPVLITLFGVGFWVISSVFQINTTNERQNIQIETNARDIADLTVTVSSLATSLDGRLKSSDTASQEILRKIDAVQKDIEILKTNK